MKIDSDGIFDFLLCVVLPFLVGIGVVLLIIAFGRLFI